MSETRRVHNPGPGEVVYTVDGRILDAHTSVVTDPSDTVTADLLAAGRLIAPITPEPRKPRRKQTPVTAGDEGES